MKKLMVVALLLTVGLTLYAGGGNETVLIYIRRGKTGAEKRMLEEEVGVMKAMLEEASFGVDIATDSGKLIKSFPERTVLLEPDLALSDVKPDGYAGLLLPCMVRGTGTEPLPEEISMVKEMARLERPIAAQHGGALVLLRAGLLEGKRYASTYQLAPSLIGGIHGGEGVLRDGNIITGSHDTYVAEYVDAKEKDTTRELTRVFIEALRE